MPILILVLAFIPAQTAAAALSLRAESLAMRSSALSASTLSAACLSVRSLLREYACSRHATSRIYALVISGSLRKARLAKLVTRNI